MIEYTHDKNGCHYVGLMRGADSVARSEEVHNGDDGSWVILDFGHDGKLVGVDIRMEDEEPAWEPCEACGEDKEPCDACKEQASEPPCECCKAELEPCNCCVECSPDHELSNG